MNSIYGLQFESNPCRFQSERTCHGNHMTICAIRSNPCSYHSVPCFIAPTWLSGFDVCGRSICVAWGGTFKTHRPMRKLDRQLLIRDKEQCLILLLKMGMGRVWCFEECGMQVWRFTCSYDINLKQSNKFWLDLLCMHILSSWVGKNKFQIFKLDHQCISKTLS